MSSGQPAGQNRESSQPTRDSLEDELAELDEDERQDLLDQFDE